MHLSKSTNYHQLNRAASGTKFPGGTWRQIEHAKADGSIFHMHAPLSQLHSGSVHNVLACFRWRADASSRSLE